MRPWQYVFTAAVLALAAVELIVRKKLPALWERTKFPFRVFSGMLVAFFAALLLVVVFMVIGSEVDFFDKTLFCLLCLCAAAVLIWRGVSLWKVWRREGK